MVLSIVALLREHEPTIVESIDLTLKRRIEGGGRLQDGEPDPNLDIYCPIEGFLDDIVALQKIKEQPPSIAFIVGVDQDIPLIREQMELTQETMGKAKLGVAQIFLEADLDLLRDARLRLSAGNNAGYEALIAGYVKTPAMLSAMITRLAKVLLLELCATGTCTYVDPLTGLGFQISYAAQVPVGNFLAPLSGGALWSAPLTAIPLTNLRDHLNAYFDNLFTLPPVIAMSSTQANQMLNAADTKVKIALMKGNLTVLSAPDATQVANLPRPSIVDCQMWIENEITAAAQSSGAAPRFLVSDAQYYPRRADSTIDRGNRKPYLPVGTYVFFTPGIVSGAFLPTATNDYEKTIAIVLDEEYKKQPREEYVGVDTRLMPLVRDPRYLAGRKVA
jgi:hypothetical protein